LKYEYDLVLAARILRTLNNENETAGKYFIVSSCKSTLNYAGGIQKPQVL